MQDRITAHNAVDIHFNTAVDDVMGDKKGVTALKIRKTDSGQSSAFYHPCLLESIVDRVCLQEIRLQARINVHSRYVNVDVLSCILQLQRCTAIGLQASRLLVKQSAHLQANSLI